MKKFNILIGYLVLTGIWAILAGVYVNLAIASYQSNGKWIGDCVIAIIWALGAIISGWRIYKVSFNEYLKNKKK